MNQSFTRKAGILLLLIFWLSAQPADAQFFRKLFKKDKNKQTEQQTETHTEHPEPRKSEKKPVDLPPTIQKERYRIDVLLPLYLDELVVDGSPVSPERIPDKAAPALNFYEGIKLAADSLSRLGYKLDVYIHDVTAEGITPESLVVNKTLEHTDLILGLLQSAQLPKIAAYAQAKQVNFVSAFTPSDAEISNNPFFIMLQPTLQTHCKTLAQTVFSKYPKGKILLCYRLQNSVDAAAYQFFMDEDTSRYVKVSCDKPLSKEMLAPLLNAQTTNVLIMPIVDPLQAEGILLELDEWFPNYRFEIYGMPSWRAIPTLRQPDYYPNIITCFSAAYHFDNTLPIAQTISTQYKKEFKGKISEMVFLGYELLFYYAQLLQQYGTIFNARQSIERPALFNSFKVLPTYDKNNKFLYYENNGIRLFRYQEGSYMVEK